MDTNIEIRTKKARLNHFDPDQMCYESETSSIMEGEIEDYISNNNNNKNVDASSKSLAKRRSILVSSQIKGANKADFRTRMINFYKELVRWLDVITTLVIIVTCILAQLENFNFYDINLQKRTTAIILANMIDKKNFSGYNTTLFDSVFNTTDFISTINKKIFHQLK